MAPWFTFPSTMPVYFLFVAWSLVSLASAQLSVSSPSGWTYQGCYVDSTSSRVLSGAFYSSSAMTEENCVSYCAKTNGGYDFADVEYANECYCGDQLLATKEPDTDCNMACSGNKTESCGGGNRLSVFSAGNIPTTNPGPGGWASLGCYADSTSARILRYTEAVPAGASGMTVAQCTAICQQYGFQYAGVEYAQECYCDNAIENGAKPTSTSCNMPCSGNSSEYCGGPNALNLYQLPNPTSPTAGAIPTGWASLGCLMDDSYWRILAVSPATPGGSANMTVENCLNACHSASYSLGGVEYSQECFCGNYLGNLAENGGPCATNASTCNMPCKGNNAETCGGSNRINMYQYGTPTSAVASCPATATATQTSTATSATSIICSPTDIVNTGLVINGDLESLSNWTYSMYGGTISLSSSAYGIAYTNCLSASIVPAPQNPPQYRFIDLYATTTRPSANTKYTVTFYQGRNSSAPTLSNPDLVLIANIGSASLAIGQVTACGGSSNPCKLIGKGGSVWQKVTATVTTNSYAFLSLYIQMNWAVNVVVSEPILIDDVSIS